MRTAIVLFTRDLRVHDHPALAAAAREAEQVVPLFVLEPRLLAESPNRTAFLADCLRDLDGTLRRLGSALVVRRSLAAVVRETKADAVFASADVSAFARRREARMYPGVTVVPPGDLAPAGKDHFRVFTPYWRRWREAPWRDLSPTLRSLSSPELDSVDVPKPCPDSPELPEGGETAGRKRLNAWLRSGIERYAELHDDLAADGTSRLSPYLHFGCLSPLEVALRAEDEAFRRQLCWRDFFAQLLAADPSLARRDMRPRPGAWNDDPDELQAWKEGRTGVPIVDAGMRQLAREGWMHNRARLITGSFLTRTLGIDWRHGERHFARLLVDGDVASNTGNWQWVAGTGANPRRNQPLNPDRQARRFDPTGEYVRRYASVD